MDLDQKMLIGNMQDLGAHDAADLDQRRTVRGIIGDLDQHHLHLDAFRFIQTADLDHVNFLVKLFFDLVAMVMLEISCRSVSPTARLSMLKPLRANNPEI